MASTTSLRILNNQPAYRPISLYRGDSFTSKPVTIKINDVAQTISGDAFTMQIKDARTDEVLLSLTSVGNAGISFPTATTFIYFLSPAQTEALLPTKKMKYDLQWVRTSDSQKKTLFVGPITNTQDVTTP